MKVYSFKRNSDNEDWHKIPFEEGAKEILPKGNFEKLEITEHITAYRDVKFGTQYLFFCTSKMFVKQIEIDGTIGFDQLKDAIDSELKTVNNSIYSEKHEPLDDLNVAYTKAINYKKY